MRQRDVWTLPEHCWDTWPDGRVACVWFPQLPLRVEVLRHPAWDGRPLVLGGGPGERKTVTLCSPEAEQAGLRLGLPQREVLALCQEAILVLPDPVRVAAVLDEVVAEIQKTVSPTVEVDGENVLVDLQGLRGLYEGDLARLEQALRGVVPALLRPRLGIGRGPFTARVAAQMAEGARARVVPVRETAAFLAPLPVRYLPLATEVQERLNLLGLRQIGDLARLPYAAVQAEFGPAGARAWRLATGQDDAPLVPRPSVQPVRAARRFDDALTSVEAILMALEYLLAQTFGDPRLAGHSVRQARLRALLSDGSSWERLYTFKEALSSREAARRALKSKLELPGSLPPAPVEEMLLELLEISGEAVKQPSLFSTRVRQEAAIGEAARQLRARYGYVPLYHAVEVEPWSRILERRWALLTCDL